MKIAFVTDSSAGISKEMEAKMGIHVIRMPLTVDGQDFLEESTITREDLIQAMLDGKTVGTSQPNIQYTLELFKDLLKDHDHIMYFPISKHLSGSYSSANMLIEDFEETLTIIDTNFVSWPLQIMITQAQSLADKGYNPKQIQKLIEEESYAYASLIPQDIQYLKRGGRIKPAAAAVANLLKITPVLKVANGEIDLSDKIRTHRKALMTGFENVIAHTPHEDYHWAVLSGEANPELVDAFVFDLENETGSPVYKGPLFPIVLAHTGPGTIAFAAVKKIKESL